MAAKFGPGPNMAATVGPTGQNVAAIFGPTMPYYVRRGPNIESIFCPVYICSRTKCGSDIWSGTKCTHICMHFFIKVTENIT